jgi:hypothetical protein
MKIPLLHGMKITKIVLSISSKSEISINNISKINPAIYRYPNQLPIKFY